MVALRIIPCTPDDHEASLADPLCATRKSAEVGQQLTSDDCRHRIAASFHAEGMPTVGQHAMRKEPTRLSPDA